MNKMIFLPSEQAEAILQEAVIKGLEAYEARRKRLDDVRLFTKNQVAKRLHRSYNTVKKHCDTGLIKTTSDGRIEESEIERYLSNS